MSTKAASLTLRRCGRMKFLPLLWAGLWRKRARTIFTLLSIVVAFVLFGMLQGVNAAFNNAVEAAAVDRLDVVSRISFTESLPISYLSQIESLPGVAGVTFKAGSAPTIRTRRTSSFPSRSMRYDFFRCIRSCSCRRTSLPPSRARAPAPWSATKLAQKYGWKIGDKVRCTRSSGRRQMAAPTGIRHRRHLRRAARPESRP